MSQRPGMRQYLAESEGIRNYEVLVDGASIEDENEHENNPGQGGYVHASNWWIKKFRTYDDTRSYMIAMTGGLGAGFAAPFMSGAEFGWISRWSSRYWTRNFGCNLCRNNNNNWVKANLALSCLGTGLLWRSNNDVSSRCARWKLIRKSKKLLIWWPVNTVKQSQSLWLWKSNCRFKNYFFSIH